jgi:ribosomal protein L11 methyltransferase
VPYRIDLANPVWNALDLLVQLGALDVEQTSNGLAALMPDSVGVDRVEEALGVTGAVVSPATGRDDGSVWVLSPRQVRAGRFVIVPAGTSAAPEGAIHLIDAPAFGTGLHPTTALCLELLDTLLDVAVPEAVLDVGTGSGVLAIAALVRGVERGVGLEIDASALEIASENARLNHVERRLDLVHGVPSDLHGTWPLVLANIVAAPLMEMAPALVRRTGRAGQLVLSGIPWTVAQEVEQVYRRLGMRLAQTETRDGWTALVFQTSW